MIFKCEKKQKQQIVRKEKEKKKTPTKTKMCTMSILAHSQCESLIKQIPLAAKEFDVDGWRSENWLLDMLGAIDVDLMDTEEKEILRLDDRFWVTVNCFAKRFYLFI